jgi:branched-chain amino acid transport system permease protein
MEIVILSLTRGAIYAIVAVGFVLVFSVGGILNLAHGTMFMLGAYLTYIYFDVVFHGAGHWALLCSIVFAIASVTAIALLLHVTVFRRKIESTSYVMVMSLAVALFVEEVLKLLFGVTGMAVPPLVRGSYVLLGSRVLFQELLLLPASLLTLAALWAFLNWTRTGRGIEAAAQCREGAILVGIRTDRVLAAVIALSAALAGLAGALVAPLITIMPSIWNYWLIKAFAIAILGGLGSLPGAIAGAFLLSFVEVATTFALSDRFAELAALVVIVAVLFIRPSGIMGVRSA